MCILCWIVLFWWSLVESLRWKLCVRSVIIIFQITLVCCNMAVTTHRHSITVSMATCLWWPPAQSLPWQLWCMVTILRAHWCPLRLSSAIRINPMNCLAPPTGISIGTQREVCFYSAGRLIAHSRHCSSRSLLYCNVMFVAPLQDVCECVCSGAHKI